jgi:hypothetical protein
MTKRNSHPQEAARMIPATRFGKDRVTDDWSIRRSRVLKQAEEVRILDPALAREYILDRQSRQSDKYDEVWEGVYIVPPLANNPHQRLVGALANVFFQLVTLEAKGDVLPGANVSDRDEGWEANFRDPDIVVVLKGGRAVDCTTHWMGGPDFLTEIESRKGEADLKLPFYERIQVREVLVIERDTRRIRLYRHDGQHLTLVAAQPFENGKWLISQVMPLAFRRRGLRSGAKIEIRRTDGQPSHWLL